MSDKYFADFPTIDYDILGNNNLTKIKDITLRPIFQNKIKNNMFAFYPYTIRDNQTVWQVANDYYGSSNYFWLVMMSANLIDPYFEFPLTHQEFLDYIELRYGDEDIQNSGIVYSSQTVKYYKTGNGYIVDKITWDQLTGDEAENKTSISIFDWEFEQNESKRNIKLIGKQYLYIIEKEKTRVFNNG